MSMSECVVCGESSVCVLCVCVVCARVSVV